MSPLRLKCWRLAGCVSPVTGALARASGKNVGTYAYSLDGLSAGPNYVLTLASNPGTFTITAKPLNVTATGGIKVYDGGTTATVTISDDRISDDHMDLSYAAAFGDKNVGTGKTVSVTNILITGGTDSGNYVLVDTSTTTTANITAKPLTVSFTTYMNPHYSGNTEAHITGRSLTGVIGAEVVGVSVDRRILPTKMSGQAK